MPVKLDEVWALTEQDVLSTTQGKVTRGGLSYASVWEVTMKCTPDLMGYLVANNTVLGLNCTWRREDNTRKVP